MLIRVVDLETTGFAPPEASVCEVGWCDISPDAIGSPVMSFVDPGHPIPPEMSAVHHIVDDDVRGCARWPEIAEAFSPERLRGFDALAAHNAKFERQFITDETTGGLRWICTYRCALRLWPQAPNHKNQTLRYWRRPDGISRLEAALSHRAGPDAYVTAFLLREMLQLASVEQLIEWSEQPALQVRCGFGKHRGELWSEIPPDYLAWASRQDMDEDVLFTIRHEMQRRQRAS